MEEKDADNIYIYHEEEDNVEDKDLSKVTELDKSGPNFSQVNSNIEEYNPEDQQEDQGPRSSPIKLMLRVMANPIEGWKAVRREHLTPERAQQGCFYPLLAVLALSKFILMAYNTSIHLSQALIDAVCSFVSFFFGYFSIIILLKVFMPKGSAECFDSDFGKVFVILSLSTLCLFYTLADAFPMLWAVLIFLPLWTIYLMCRGTKFLRFPESKQMTCTFILCLMVIGIPSMISWILGFFIPS